MAISISEPNDLDPWGHQGGPAFPANAGSLRYKGMSLRDWFAGQALAGMLAASVHESADWQVFAEGAYAAADAMLAERDVAAKDER